MKLDEFVDLVKQMRTAQTTYFRLRRAGMEVWQDEVAIALSVSRELERRVDAAIVSIQDKQGKLFEG